MMQTICDRHFGALIHEPMWEIFLPIWLAHNRHPTPLRTGRFWRSRLGGRPRQRCADFTALAWMAFLRLDYAQPHLFYPPLQDLDSKVYFKVGMSSDVEALQRRVRELEQELNAQAYLSSCSLPRRMRGRWRGSSWIFGEHLRRRPETVKA